MPSLKPAASRTLRQLFFATLVVWLATATLAQADWRVVSTTRENSPNELVEHRRTELENPATGARATLQIAIFQTRSATLRAIDQPAAERRDLAEVMAQEHALAGVNGGYFDPQDAPVGLLVTGGKKVTPLSTAHLLSGVLFATAKHVEIVRTKRFRMNDTIREAVQCGPLLLEEGKAVAGLNDTRNARRTFAAVNARGTEAALGNCSAVSLAQLAQILAQPQIAGETKFARALNLDGGSSSAFWVGPATEAFSISEQKTVRDFVAIVPRSTR